MSRNNEFFNEFSLNGVKEFILDTLKNNPKLARTIAVALIASGALTYISYSSDVSPQVALAQSVENPDQGTVPEPTVTPEITATPEPEAITLGNFNFIVKTDLGVVIAFVNGPSIEDSVLDDTVDLSTWGYSIAPNTNIDGRSQPAQFPLAGEQGVVIGAIAENYYQQIIAQYEAAGDFNTANYLRTRYGEIKPLTDGTAIIDNLRRSEGEGPLGIRAQVVTDVDGRQSIIISYRWPEYRQQSPTGALQEVGVDVGMLEPVSMSEPSPIASLDEGILVAFSSGDAPALEVSVDGETVAISTEPLARIAAFSDVSSIAAEPNDLGFIEVEAVDELMLTRNEYFKQLMVEINNSGALVSTAAFQEAPKALPFGDRKLAMIIKGTDLVSPDGRYQLTFNVQGDQKGSIIAELSDILPTDKIKLKIVNNELVVENLGPDNHVPHIELLQVQEVPEEPTTEGPTVEPTDDPATIPVETPESPVEGTVTHTVTPQPNVTETPAVTPQPNVTGTPRPPGNPGEPVNVFDSKLFIPYGSK